MSTKQIEAVVMVLSAIVIAAWVMMDVQGTGLAPNAAAAASDMLWAIGAVIVFNIVAMIVGVILVSIAQREEVKDERADERDQLINGKSNSVAYLLLSLGVLAVLIGQALGVADNLVPYLLFGVSLLAGVGSAIAKLVLYRVS
jgi:predicted membrane protein